mgnify:CR=1 FL=1
MTEKLYVFTSKCRIVARHLIDEIKSGKYRPGDKLDSINTLSQRLGVGRRVVAMAFAILAKENYVITEHGSGTYINPQLKCGQFYRLGLFINQQNPMMSGWTITSVFQKARKLGYQTVLGSNFEQELELSDWLQSEKQLDGVLITGIVNDQLLQYPRRNNVPYVVIGNYDISPEHPQATTNVRKKAHAAFLPVFSTRRYHRIGIIIGISEFRATREFVQGIRDAIGECGLPVEEKLICHAEDDGYAAVVKLLEIDKADLIYVHCDMTLGLKKYLERHDVPPERRPLILTNSWGAAILPAKYYDRKIDINDELDKRVSNALAMLVKSINGTTNNR